MKLYVMRHGPAEDQAASGRDQDRALTATGRDRVRGVVRLLQSEGEMPGRILASHLVRAQQTAEIVSAQSKGAVETVCELAPGGKSSELVEELVARGAVAPMIVGHEPDLSTLIDHLMHAPFPMPMDKAMVVALELAGAGTGPASLLFVVEPRSLTVVHDARGARKT